LPFRLAAFEAAKRLRPGAPPLTAMSRRAHSRMSEFGTTRSFTDVRAMSAIAAISDLKCSL